MSTNDESLTSPTDVGTAPDGGDPPVEPSTEPTSSNAQSPIADFIPDRNTLTLFALYAINGGIWASVLGLELMTRDSVDGFRGVFILSWLATFIVATATKGLLNKLPEGTGNELKQNGLQSAIRDFMLVTLGTLSGVASGMAFSGHGDALATTMGIGTSAGSAIGLLIFALLGVAITNGAWKSESKSPIGGAGLAVIGVVALSIGAMVLMSGTNLIDSAMAFKEKLSSTESVQNGPDLATMLGFGTIHTAIRGILGSLMQLLSGIGLLLLGLGMVLASLNVLQKNKAERADSVGASFRLCSSGFTALSLYFGLGMILIVDAALINVGAGPTTLKTSGLLLFAFFLFPHTRTLSNAFISINPKAVLKMRGS